MRRRKESPARRAAAILLSAILIAGMLSNAVPTNVLAKEAADVSTDAETQKSGGDVTVPAGQETATESGDESGTKPVEEPGDAPEIKPANPAEGEGAPKPGEEPGAEPPVTGGQDGVSEPAPNDGTGQETSAPGDGAEEETPVPEDGTEEGTVSGNDAVQEIVAAPQRVMMAAEPVVQAKFPYEGDDWEIDADGKLTISSERGMSDWIDSGLDTYRHDILKAEILEGVTSICMSMFTACINLKEITLPAGVTQIESYAFQDCISLKEITLPASVTNINDSAFQDCSGLTGITLPASVMQIEGRAFADCISLTEVNMKSETPPLLLGTDVFRDCGFVTGNQQGIHVPEGKAQAYKTAWTDWAAYIADDAPTPPVEKHEHNDVTFTAWTKADSLPTDAGNYYLTKDVTLTETWNVPSGTTSLCLNGNTISASGKYTVIKIAGSDTLNLYDCKDGGNITGGQGGVMNDGTLHMYGGKISGNGRESYGGGVCNAGTFIMFGGVISGNSAYYYGGGVYVADGTFCMYDGNISANTNDMGGGVYVKQGTFTVGGSAVISGNVYNGKANNVYLKDGVTITIDSDKPLSGSASIGIMTKTAPTDGSPVNITGANGADYSKYFTSDNADYEIVNGESNVVQLAVVPKYDVTVNGGTVSGGTGSASYKAGVTVTITANAPESGKAFDKWVVNSGGVTLANAANATTTFTMPAQAVEVTATYKASVSDADKVAAAKTVVEEALAGITATNATTKTDIQNVIDTALGNAGITDVTVTVGNLTKTNATTSAEGSVSGSISISCGSASDSVPINKTIAKLTAGKYTVTVNGGIGGGEYAEGETVTITANSPASGKAFDKWVVNSGGVTLANAANATTTFIMPAQAVSVTANYKDTENPPTPPTPAEKYTVTVNSGTGGGDYAAGDTVTIKANASASGKQFNKWEVNSGTVTLASATSSATTFTMPAEAVTVTATYKNKSGGGHSGGGSDSDDDHSGDSDNADGGDTNNGGGNADGGNNNNGGGDNGSGSSGGNGGAGQPGNTGGTGAGQPKVKQEKEGNIRKEVRVEGEDTLDAAVETPLSELADMVLTKEEKQKAAGGTDIRIVLDVKDASTVVSAADKTLVEKALNGPQAKGYTLGQYLDISLYKVIGDSRNIITETNGKLTVTIDVPDSLKNTDAVKTRTFAVIRVHNGKAELLPDLDSNADTITIKTDRFSTYAVVYKDTAGGKGDGAQSESGKPGVVRVSANSDGKNPGGGKDGEPKTEDRTPLELSATLAMIAGLTYLLLYFADRRHGMTEETKKELVSRMIGWAKQGGRIRKWLALAAIFVLLVYYHSIGKKSCAEWREVYGE